MFIFFPLFVAYFLEDIVEMLNFDPPPDTSRKNKKDKDKDDENVGAEDDENMNLKVGEEYEPSTRHAVSKMSEKEISFELIEVRLKMKSWNESFWLPSQWANCGVAPIYVTYQTKNSDS